MRLFKPKGLRIFKAVDHRYLPIAPGRPCYIYRASIKGRGRLGARTRSIFSRLPESTKQSVLETWLKGHAAEMPA